MHWWLRGERGISDEGPQRVGSLPLAVSAAESMYLSFKKVIGSAGVGQGSLGPGVHFNEPGMGTKTGPWPSPLSEGEVLAQTLLQILNDTLGF